jgi:hypothetical protein
MRPPKPIMRSWSMALPLKRLLSLKLKSPKLRPVWPKLKQALRLKKSPRLRLMLPKLRLI